MKHNSQEKALHCSWAEAIKQNLEKIKYDDSSRKNNYQWLGHYDTHQ